MRGEEDEVKECGDDKVKPFTTEGTEERRENRVIENQRICANWALLCVTPCPLWLSF
jgi:hypothetical protein